MKDQAGAQLGQKCKITKVQKAILDKMKENKEFNIIKNRLN